MKSLILIAMGALVLTVSGCSQKSSQEGSMPASVKNHSAASGNVPESFTGDIMDSMCASMGGHGQMASSNDAKGAQECTLKCIKMGAKYVLYDSEHKITYQLDDQTKPQEFAGHRVEITGTLDKATKTIHVESIQAA